MASWWCLCTARGPRYTTILFHAVSRLRYWGESNGGTYKDTLTLKSVSGQTSDRWTNSYLPDRLSSFSFYSAPRKEGPLPGSGAVSNGILSLDSAAGVAYPRAEVYPNFAAEVPEEGYSLRLMDWADIGPESEPLAQYGTVCIVFCLDIGECMSTRQREDSKFLIIN